MRRFFKLVILNFYARPVRKLLSIFLKASEKSLALFRIAYRNHVGGYNWSLVGTGLLAKDSGATDHQLDPEFKKYYLHLSNIVIEFPLQPVFSILLPIDGTIESQLEEALASVAFQVYKNWQVCAVTSPNLTENSRKVLQRFYDKYPDKCRKLEVNSSVSICELSNLCLGLANGDFITLLSPTDRLYPHSLAEVVRHSNLNASSDIFYSDEIEIDALGLSRGGSIFKPSWSPLLQLGTGYCSGLSTFRTSLIKAAGGFKNGFDGAHNFELFLRASETTVNPITHIPLVLYQKRAKPCKNMGDDPSLYSAVTAQTRAITEACMRRGYPAEVVHVPDLNHYRIKFALKKLPPKVSIVIPSKERLELITSCLTSIFEKTTYSDYEIVIADNGSADPDTLKYYDSLRLQYPKIVKIVTFGSYFNFARLINSGVAASSGEFVILLNNDTVVITPGWIEEMLGVAQLPAVGAVGPMLLYPNNKIQFAGTMTIGKSIATHMYCHLRQDEPSYKEPIQTMRETTCITGACLMISKAKFYQVDGLDEIYLPNGYGDVDFCLKLLSFGLNNVYVPAARLYHLESPSRGVNVEVFERLKLLRKWPQFLLTDPYRNFNLDQSTFLMPEAQMQMPEISSEELADRLHSAF